MRPAAEERDEIASDHSITASASASNLSGISRPIPGVDPGLSIGVRSIRPIAH
jgi:hypothetical protein